MEKDRTKGPVADPIFPSLTPASTSQMLLPRAVLDTRLALRDFLLAAGLQELRKAFEEDRTLLCGPKGKVQTDRRPTDTATMWASSCSGAARSASRSREHAVSTDASWSCRTGATSVRRTRWMSGCSGRSCSG